MPCDAIPEGEIIVKTIAALTAACAAVLIASAASAQEARIAWGDLDLGSTVGVQAFDARVETAARQMCRDARRPNSRISDRSGCQAAVRAEAVRQLPRAARVDYAQARGQLTA